MWCGITNAVTQILRSFLPFLENPVEVSVGNSSSFINPKMNVNTNDTFVQELLTRVEINVWSEVLTDEHVEN